jgi:hypothetical protein
MFKPQFAPLVERGEKLQTVRPTPKRMPKPGDKISLRAWTGLPYRSKQRVLMESTITRVETIRISAAGIMLGDGLLIRPLDNEFARADGFDHFPEMADWFQQAHGLPFEGIVIYWYNAEPIHGEKDA